jgi:RNA polymerase sigma-70 factor (ECF subfamily)
MEKQWRLDMSVNPSLHIVRKDQSSQIDSKVDIDDLFRRYSAYVAYIAHRIVGDPADAEDLVQEVFLDAHRGLRMFEGQAAVKGWLAVVTTRRAGRFLKRRNLKLKLGLREASTYTELVDRSATPEQTAIAASIYRALDKLPVNDRIAWTLRYIQDETLERVAELAGCSRATAHRRITAASVVLKEILSDD